MTAGFDMGTKTGGAALGFGRRSERLLYKDIVSVHFARGVYSSR